MLQIMFAVLLSDSKNGAVEGRRFTHDCFYPRRYVIQRKHNVSEVLLRNRESHSETRSMSLGVRGSRFVGARLRQEMVRSNRESLPVPLCYRRTTFFVYRQALSAAAVERPKRQ